MKNSHISLAGLGLFGLLMAPTTASAGGGSGGRCSGTIGNFVWSDLSNNGIQDPGEPGINGVSIVLKNSSGAVIRSVRTPVNASPGSYAFTELCAGTYTVEVLPSPPLNGTVPTPSNVGPDRAVDSNGSPAIVKLTADDSTNNKVDFGYCPACGGVIGDFVWNDTDRDGIQDFGEPGLPGVGVELVRSGTVVATTTTGGNGGYRFTGLCDGTYTVRVTGGVPSGFTPTIQNPPGGNPSNDSNGSPATVTLTSSNATDHSIDFGFKPRSTCAGVIGDFVWRDADRDGVQDFGESGIDGVSVRLRNDAGTTLATVVTSGGGRYQFSGYCAGRYTVEVDATTLPAGLTPTIQFGPGSSAATDSNLSPAPVTLATDTGVDRTIDFGFVSACAGVIGDRVWNDLNRNGIQNAGEPGLSGLVVNLRNPADHSLIEQTTTGANGIYRFTGRCAGTYKVEVVPPSGNEPSPTNAGSPDLDSNGNPALVNLPNDNWTDVTIDFGFFAKRTVLLVIDEDSIDNGNPPNFFSAFDVNDDRAEIGVRAQLRYFASNVGRTITLHTGQVGDEGWFALKTIPSSWNSAGGLAGFLGNPAASVNAPPPHGVGPGLGAPDAKGDRESLLDKIPNVTPLRATGLKMLEGDCVCAVVFDSDISMNYGPLNGSLKGANLGTVAFQVLSVTQLTGFSSSSLPKVEVRILDARQVCQGMGMANLFTAAPAPYSSSVPVDVVP